MQKADTLDRSLAKCLQTMSDREREVQELLEGTRLVLQKLDRGGSIQEQPLREELEELFAEALEDACSRDVVGAMDVFESTGAALDRLSRLMTCAGAVEGMMVGFVESPREDSASNTDWFAEAQAVVASPRQQDDLSVTRSVASTPCHENYGKQD